MKISPVSFNTLTKLTPLKAKNQQTQTNQTNFISSEISNNSNVSFGAIRRTPQEAKKLKEIKKAFTPESEEIYKKAVDLAKASHSKEVEMWHLYLANMIEFRDYIAQVDRGEMDAEKEMRYQTVIMFPSKLYRECDIWRNDELRANITAVIDEHIANLQKAFVTPELMKNPRPTLYTPELSKEAITVMHETMTNNCGEEEPGASSKTFYDDDINYATEMTRDKKLKREVFNFDMALRKVALSETVEPDENCHIEFYNKKADVLWKNINHGNSVIIISELENQKSNAYLQNAFANLLDDSGAKYHNIDPEKTQIIALNDHADFGFVERLTRDIQFDTDKKDTLTVMMGNLHHLFNNNSGSIDISALNLLKNARTKASQAGGLVKYVFFIPSEIYHMNTKDPNAPIAELLMSMAQQSLPILNAADARTYLTNESGLKYVKSKVGKEVSPETVLKTIELTSSKEGNYPEKAIDLLNAVGKYFIDEDEITTSQVTQYIKEIENLSEATGSEERTIIFDTGKTLDDIKGSPMTRAEALSIANQIKKGTIGTKGIVVFHNHGDAYGGGRKHTVEAIAGETGVPIIYVNGREFVNKNIDELAQQADMAEIKIKKMTSLAKTQAEANKLNTAIIFIENFDGFGANPLWGISSVFEQKAAAQLLSEMDIARKEGKVNLVVMGSMNMPELLDENIMKPYKFLDQLRVFQPRDNAQRREILEYYIAKNNVNVANGDVKQTDKILTDVAKLTDGFKVVDLMYLLDMSKIVADERGKEAIDRSDFTEAYLRTVSGRSDSSFVSDDRKKIVTSHEAGHALTLTVMNEIMKKQGKFYRLPGEVSFITLDPRGDFGGAMFWNIENEEYSFERVMGGIVTDYGGNSAENTIYGIQGSWGISEDMRMADWSAEVAVTRMGMGPKMGVRHTREDSGFLSEHKKELIEQDMEGMTVTGKQISDMIVEEFKDFILEFTDRHYAKVATGECLVSAEEFEAHLVDWYNRQDEEKKEKINSLRPRIEAKLEACKKGEAIIDV